MIAERVWQGGLNSGPTGHLNGFHTECPRDLVNTGLGAHFNGSFNRRDIHLALHRNGDSTDTKIVEVRPNRRKVSSIYEFLLTQHGPDARQDKGAKHVVYLCGRQSALIVDPPCQHRH